MSKLLEEVLETKTPIRAMDCHSLSRRQGDRFEMADILLEPREAEKSGFDVVEESYGRAIHDMRRGMKMIDHLRSHFANRELATECVDLNATALAALAGSRTELQGAGITTRCDLAYDLPLLSGDGDQLRQVIVNLVGNAIEAMRVIGHRKLVLTVTTRWYRDDRVMLGVRDGGTGVAPRDLQRQFDPMYRPERDGAGVGLCVSRAVVERHGGQLWTDCNDGQGVSFWMSLPVSPEPIPVCRRTPRALSLSRE
jgi:signal transduction histidine kinase